MKKKILFILHYPPPVHGAAMVGKFIKESDFINSAFDCTYINLGTSTNLGDIGKSGLGKIKSVFKIQWEVYKALKKIKPDLCYMTLTANGAGFYKDVLIVKVLKFFNTKIIYHFHNKGFKQSVTNGLNRFLHRFALRHTKSILLSQHLYPDIRYYVKKDQIYVCPNGIPSSAPVSNSKQKVAPTLKVLYLSNMMVEKGVWILLEACKILKLRSVNFQCDFVGDWFGINEDEFQSKVTEYGLSTEVLAHGKKYGADKIDFFENASVFVFPTFYRNECFPLVLLEAMDYALPVISTPEGGIADIVSEGETGFLVPQKDALALADKLEFLSTQPLLSQEMGRAGKIRFDTLFTLVKFEKNLCNILEKESFS
ncbi:MAG: glycosyltransferase family 4 protein [Ginsengibacter sp.]